MSEETSHISETDEQLRAKKRKRRVRYAILYPAILIALSVLCYFLYRIDDFVHVCRIPPGTTVVDSGSIKPYDPVFDDFFRSGKHPKLQSYLMYRHYVIPDGVTEIGPEFTQTHVHRVSDAIQPSHPLQFIPLPFPSLMSMYLFSVCVSISVLDRKSVV